VPTAVLCCRPHQKHLGYSENPVCLKCNTCSWAHQFLLLLVHLYLHPAAAVVAVVVYHVSPPPPQVLLCQPRLRRWAPRWLMLPARLPRRHSMTQQSLLLSQRRPCVAHHQQHLPPKRAPDRRSWVRIPPTASVDGNAAAQRSSFSNSTVDVGPVWQCPAVAAAAAVVNG